MSGVEAAGFVIGSIPLVIEFLKSTAVGLESTKLFSTRRFRRQIQGWETVLMTKRASLLNNITLVIRATDILNCDLKDIKDLLQKQEIPEIFTDAHLSAQLNELLGHNRGPFERNFLELRAQFEEIQNRLGITKSQTNEVYANADRGFWEERAHRVKIILGQKVYEEIVNKLETANANLSEITDQILKLQEFEDTDRHIRQPLRKLRQLRKDAQDLLKVLSSANLWPCCCSNGHALWLKLREYHGKPPKTNSTFEISCSEAITDPTIPLHRKVTTFFVRGTEIDAQNMQGPGSRLTNSSASVKTTSIGSVQVDPNPNAIRTLNGNSLGVNQDATASNTSISKSSKMKDMFRSHSPQPKQVKFVDTTSKPSSNPKTVPSVPAKEIKSLCEALVKTSTQKVDASLVIGELHSTTDASKRYEFLQQPSKYVGQNTVALSCVTCNLRACTENHHKACPEFEVDDRLLLAATLAQCTFQLQGNWLQGEWTCKDIIVPIAAHDSSPCIEELQVICNVRQTSQQSTSTSSNKNLNALGIALAEVLLGRHITNTGTDLALIQDLITRIYKKYGQKSDVGNAVRECIFWSGCASKEGFDDEDFSAEVYKLVIWPIIQQYRKHKALPI